MNDYSNLRDAPGSGASDTDITDITDADAGIDQSERNFFENPGPEHRAIVSVSYRQAPFEWFARLRYYGAWSDLNGDIEADYQKFGGRTFFDIGLTWDLNDQLAMRLGAENVFNTYPQEARRQANRGLIYSRNTPYDTDGGLVYARLTSRF